MNKKEIREKYKKIRDNITDKKEKEDKILSNLLPFLEKYENILSYSSINHEVNTKIINNHIKILALPLVFKKSLVAKIVKNLESDTDVGTYGILEPKPTLATMYDDYIDAVIVPGICFSKDFYRIGYGGGYYDRFLEDLNVLKIGICFEEQIVDTLSPEMHDIPLDVIITDKNVYIK